ncbi:MAG: hypothetical protein WC273_10275 [Dehalococcoidia bacterium]
MEIVGPGGAGKTTMVNPLMRLADVTGGRSSRRRSRASMSQHSPRRRADAGSVRRTHHH